MRPSERVAAVAHRIIRRSPGVSLALYVVGLVTASVVLRLARDVFVDENAFLLGSLSASFSLADAEIARSYAHAYDAAMRAGGGPTNATLGWNWIASTLNARGFESYAFRSDSGAVNAHAIARAMRGNGRESFALVTTLGSGDAASEAVTVGAALRVFETVGRAEWLAKDLIWVCVDDSNGEGIESTMTWLKTYYSPSHRGANGEPFERAGAIMQAFAFSARNGETISAMRVKLEGWNGAYPNQDIFTMFRQVVTGSPSVALPVTLEEGSEGERAWEDDTSYSSLAASAMRFLWRAATGTPTGVHAAFKRHSIDAISIETTHRPGDKRVHRGVQAYVVMGQALELTLRACNNLLELLHHSCFYYVMLGPHKFLGIAEYIAPQAIMLVSLVLTLVKLTTFGAESNGKLPEGETRTRHEWFLALARLALALLFGHFVGKSCISLHTMGLTHEVVTMGVSAIVVIATVAFLRLTRDDATTANQLSTSAGVTIVHQERWVGVKVVNIAWLLFTMSACTFFNFALALIVTMTLTPVCLLCAPSASHTHRLKMMTVLCSIPWSAALALSLFAGTSPTQTFGMLAEHHSRWNTFALPVVFLIAFPNVLLALSVASASPNVKCKTT